MLFIFFNEVIYPTHLNSGRGIERGKFLITKPNFSEILKLLNMTVKKIDNRN